MHIVFRLDSSNAIGSGHVMRCLALAEVLRTKKAQVTFITRLLTGHSISAIKNARFDVLELKNQPHIPWQLDAEQTIAFLKTMGQVDWVIVDHYALDAAWEESIRSYAPHIAVIDDLADRNHDCDLLIDQNYYHHSIYRYEKKLPKTCRVYIGPRYALLRSEFREARMSLKPRNGIVRQLLLFFGGNDTDNLTTFVLSALEHAFFMNLSITVVVGGANPWRETIRSYCIKKNYHYYCGVNNMAQLMACSDFAIGAGGVSTWERCCMGLPSLIVSLAHNQEALVNNALSAHIFEYAGSSSSLCKDYFVEQLAALISNPARLRVMSKNGEALVDGWGAERVADLLLSYGGLNVGY